MATIVKIVWKANKQMSRRQGKEGNHKLYHMIEETITECLRMETWIVLANFLYFLSCFWSNKIQSVVRFAYNVSNHQCGLDSSQMDKWVEKIASQIFSLKTEYFKNFLPFSSMLFIISGALLKEAGYLKIITFDSGNYLNMWVTFDVFKSNRMIKLKIASKKEWTRL